MSNPTSVLAASLLFLVIGAEAVDITLKDQPLGAKTIQYLDTADGANWVATSTSGLTIPAKVPGDIVTDLYDNGMIGNPLYAQNWKNSTLWRGDWTYSTHFKVTETEGSDVLLVLDGVKMGASISVDGVVIGQTNDQFLRYTFNITNLTTTTPSTMLHTLTVAFSTGIDCEGRYMACTGGWDWAFYGKEQQGNPNTFSKGIWKSVYIATIAQVGITHVVPRVYYQGPYPTSPLSDATVESFEVDVTVHCLFGRVGDYVVSVATDWGQSSSLDLTVTSPGGQNVSQKLQVHPRSVKLWWPVGSGAQPLYHVNVSIALKSRQQELLASSSRRVGFRTLALVTGNDTDPEYVKRAETEEGTELHGMFFRINGALIFCRGANMIPMEEMEGWMDAGALITTVESAVAANFNMLRLWGGGIYMPQVWYDVCDELGVLVFHDVMYAQRHPPDTTPVQEAELRHQVRRLAHHPSIVIWDGCNECTVVMSDPKTSIYATFVLRVVAEEDNSRPIWPSCPATGWTAGVHKLNSFPNGNALSTPDTTPHRCTEIPGAKCIEVHRPKWQGSGFPAVNGHASLAPKTSSGLWPWNFYGTFPNNIPLRLFENTISPALRNNFSSESPGATTFSSFESMSPTLPPEHWGIHSGQPANNCTGPVCEGPNDMAQRNYPCDNFIVVYFGNNTDRDATGPHAFKQQIFQCMIAQALVIKQNIELTRSQNRFGTLVWQFNEIWPTGGWGSIEYGNPKFPGQVIGGRWKPLQHWFQASIFADVMATCDGTGLCYIRNDNTASFSGKLSIVATDFQSGADKVLLQEQVTLPAGAGAVKWFRVPGIAGLKRPTSVLEAVVNGDDDVVRSINVIPLSTPEHMMLSDSKLSITTSRAEDGFNVHVSCEAVAMYVTLTTLAHGRFERNAFLLRPPSTTVKFLPASTTLLPRSLDDEYQTFVESVRVEDVWTYSSQQRS